jgi:hypothetical protein
MKPNSCIIIAVIGDLRTVTSRLAVSGQHLREIDLDFQFFGTSELNGGGPSCRSLKPLTQSATRVGI